MGLITGMDIIRVLVYFSVFVTGEKDANHLFAPAEDRTRVSCVLIQHSIASL